MVSSLALDPRGTVVARTNRVFNPILGAAATGWSGGFGAPQAGTFARVQLNMTWAWWAQLTFTSASAGSGSSVIYAASTTGVTPGSNYFARIFGWVNWAGAQTRAVIYWYSAANAVLGSAPGVAAVHASGAAEWRTTVGTAPAGTAYARIDFQHSGGVGPSVTGTPKMAATAAFLIANNANTNYFDGGTGPAGDAVYSWSGTPNASSSIETISDPDTSSAAIFALGYEITRAQHTIIHDVPAASAPVVTLRPAGPRSGRISYLFSDYETARRAEVIHSRAGVIVLADPDWPAGGMRYVAQDDMRLTLDPDTRAKWVLDTGFLEVPA